MLAFGSSFGKGFPQAFVRCVPAVGNKGHKGSIQRSQEMKKSTNRKRPIRKALLFIVSAALAMAFLPAAALAAPTVTVPFDDYDLTGGETKNWEVPLSNLALAPKLDVMYVIDTTGSMGGQRVTVAATVSQFSSDLLFAGATDIYFGAAFFGDWNVDDPWFGIPLKLGDYDEATVTDAIKNLKTTGGGDAPEDALWAYMRAIYETDWRDDATHVVVLITDQTTKIRDAETVGTYIVNLDGAAEITADYNIIPGLVSHTGTLANPLADLAAALTVTEYGWRNEITLADALGLAVIPPVNDSYFFEARIESITYSSDNAASTDVTASVSPASFILDPGDVNKFDLSATATTTPARYGDVTIVEVGFYIDGVRISSATQYLYFTVASIVLPESPLPGTGDSGAMLLIATLLTALVGTSLFFAGRREQRKER